MMSELSAEIVPDVCTRFGETITELLPLLRDDVSRDLSKDTTSFGA